MLINTTPPPQPQLVSPIGGALTGRAAYGGGDPSSGCGCVRGSNAAQAAVAGPVDTASGDYMLSATDLMMLDRGGPTLELSRTYDARLAQSDLVSGASTGALGYGWTYGLGMTLSFNASSQIISQENGATVTFDAAGPSPPAWCASGQGFCPTAPRVLAALSHNTDGTWTFTRRVQGQQTFTFSAAGQLVKVTDESGNALTAIAGTPGSGACPSSAAACTMWTSSASGRSLTLVFDSGVGC